MDMMREIEEALSIAVLQSLNDRYSQMPRALKTTKYTSMESAPAHHGMRIDFEDGTQVEVLLRKV